MLIPILNGNYTDGNADIKVSYPRNYIPVPKKQGISSGYLRPAEGIVEFATGPGIDRGGFNWNGDLYRVMGSKLVKSSANGALTEIGDVGGTNTQVKFDCSFDRLAVASNGKLFYYDGTTLTEVTDPDLGTVIGLLWVDSYFMTTDGSYLVVTELTDPTSVNPLKYGSAETDPDSIKGLLKLRNEVHAIGRYTIEVYENIGGSLFPFQRIPGARVEAGAIGSSAFCTYKIKDYLGIAFVGGNKNNPASVWFSINGSTTQLSTAEIDGVLQSYGESVLADVVVESRIDKAKALLYVHLPDQTLVYDSAASAIIGEPVWFSLTSSLDTLGTYRARNFVWCYDKWISGDPTSFKLGYFVENSAHHYGDVIGWDFGTAIIYNESRGAIFHELELIIIAGSIELGKTPTIWTSYSKDGVTWSQERPRTIGRQGERDKRINWLQQGSMENWRIQRFRGTSDAHISIARLEARLEPLFN